MQEWFFTSAVIAILGMAVGISTFMMFGIIVLAVVFKIKTH
tara:strand:- start:40 stop:162 length:123 start_codon:yes stop_codon:yes gene_type:complete